MSSENMLICSCCSSAYPPDQICFMGRGGKMSRRLMNADEFILWQGALYNRNLLLGIQRSYEYIAFPTETQKTS